MPVNLSIKNAPDDVVALLKVRAKRNHRSLQGELLSIIEDAVQKPVQLDIERIVTRLREGLPLGGRRFTRDEMHEN
jgi:plasmid stability protein